MTWRRCGERGTVHGAAPADSRDIVSLVADISMGAGRCPCLSVGSVRSSTKRKGRLHRNGLLMPEIATGGIKTTGKQGIRDGFAAAVARGGLPSLLRVESDLHVFEREVSPTTAEDLAEERIRHGLLVEGAVGHEPGIGRGEVLKKCTIHCNAHAARRLGGRGSVHHKSEPARVDHPKGVVPHGGVTSTWSGSGRHIFVSATAKSFSPGLARKPSLARSTMKTLMTGPGAGSFAAHARAHRWPRPGSTPSLRSYPRQMTCTVLCYHQLNTFFLI